MAVLACGGPAPTTGPNSSPSSAIPSSSSGLLQGYWWFDLNWTAEQRLGAEPDVPWEPITSVTLAMGRLDGDPIGELVRVADPKPFVSFRSLEPFAHRIDRDALVLGYFDGQRSRIESVAADTGAAEVIFESTQPVHNALVSRDRRTLYAVLLDPKARTEAGVWAFDVASGDAEGKMLIPASRFDPERGGLIEDLYLSPDDLSLVVRDCYRECRVRVVDLVTRKVRTLAQKLPAGGTSAHGLTDHKIVIDANCELPCPLLALDLDTGQQSAVGWECSTAVIVDSTKGPLVVSDGRPDSCRDGLHIVASSVEALAEPVEVFRTDVADASLVSLGDRFDALLPEGSFMVAIGPTPVGEQPRGFPSLIDAVTGTAIPLQELRSR